MTPQEANAKLKKDRKEWADKIVRLRARPDIPKEVVSTTCKTFTRSSLTHTPHGIVKVIETIPNTEYWREIYG